MKLGGFEIVPKCLYVIFGFSLLFFLLLSLLTSYTTGLLFVTSFFFGAASFSVILDACPGHLVPNFLFALKSPKLLEVDTDLQKCRKEPWKNIEAPIEIDEALTDFLERILREYVYSWYGRISLDEDFMQDVRVSIRYAASVLIKRFGKLDLTDLIIERGIPIGLSHVDAFFNAFQSQSSTNFIENYLKYVGDDLHPAALSREKEVTHIQNVSNSILPYLLPQKILKTRIAHTLIVDILSGAVLQPLMDLLADPDTINFILEVSFSPEKSRVFPKASGKKVEFLKCFVTNFQPPIKMAMRMDLSAILKNQQALFAFMQFLKEEGDFNHLQFCFSIEDLNKRIMAPDLTHDEVKSLHKEALDLFNNYLKKTAQHKVQISDEIVESLRPMVMDEPIENVIHLRASNLLSRAYEEIYISLESKCQSFYKSEQYYTFLLGKRSEESANARFNAKKRNRNVQKIREKNQKIFSLKYLPPPPAANSRFYLPIENQRLALDPKSAFKIQYQRSLSKSLEDLRPSKPSQDPISRLNMQEGHLRTRSNSVGNPKGFVKVKRKESPKSRWFYDIEDPLPTIPSSKRISREPKSKTLPARMPSQVPRKPTGFRSKWKLAIRRKHGSGSKSMDRLLGRSLSKLKQGVLGRSVDGLAVEDVLDTGFDVADSCQDDESDFEGGSQTSALNSMFYRDLTTWTVSIPQYLTSEDSNGKPCFVYVIRVNRTNTESIAAKLDSGDHSDMSWCVERQFDEFYALESKLTEFHGEFEDAKLPSKSKFFTGIGLDIVQSRQSAFEEYLKTLLTKPALRESDLLFTFLTSSEEFTDAPSNIGLGKMIKNVPLKLTKERGQGLQPFIQSLINSTQSEPSKPRYDVAVPSEEDLNMSERLIPPHSIFQDNFQTQKIPHAKEMEVITKDLKQIGVFDTLFYLAIKIFQVSKERVQLLSGIRLLFRKSFDHLVHYAIASKLSEVLSVRRVVYICHLLEEAIFDNPEQRTDEEKAERKIRALETFQTFIHPIWTPLMGEKRFHEGTKLVFDALQNPIINKQLAMVLLNSAVSELFPELKQVE